MKKIIAIALVAYCLISTHISAQNSLGLNLGMYKPGVKGSDAQLGGQVSFKHNVSDQVRIGGNLGYYSSSTELLGLKFTSSTMPITALFEYSFSDATFSPYAGADLGVYRFGSKTSNGISTSSSFLGFAPVAGANYEVSDNLALNLNVKYHVIFNNGGNSSAIGVNVGGIILF
ncbi:MAG: outer membrane beta-barrel protein [Bacteroidota bacterium]|jgi:opacity protein-like surface antigen